MNDNEKHFVDVVASGYRRLLEEEGMPDPLEQDRSERALDAVLLALQSEHPELALPTMPESHERPRDAWRLQCMLMLWHQSDAMRRIREAVSP